MGAAWETTAVEFLHGSHRQTLFLPRNMSVWRNRVLWGTLRSRIHSPRISAKHISFLPSCRLKVRAAVSGDVSSVVDDKSRELQIPTEKVLHFFRIPLIQEGATAELLKSAQTKVSNRIVGLKTEQCFNVGLDSGLSSEKLIVYAPIDFPAIKSAISGEDSTNIPILPSGFIISGDGCCPDKRTGGASTSSTGNTRSGGSLLTVAFQILVCTLSHSKQMDMDSVTTVNTLVSSTVQKIKAALDCSGVDP